VSLAAGLSVGAVLLTMTVPFAVGLLDIVLSLVDNRLGVITGAGIEAVKDLGVGKTTMSRHLASRFSSVTWSALHDDDDSLRSVRVFAEGTAPNSPPVEIQWCVNFEWHLSGLRVQSVAPANHEAWEATPSLHSAYEEIRSPSYSCAAIEHYFRKSFDASASSPALVGSGR
jgi:hypothetical protein